MLPAQKFVVMLLTVASMQSHFITRHTVGLHGYPMLSTVLSHKVVIMTALATLAVKCDKHPAASYVCAVCDVTLMCTLSQQVAKSFSWTSRHKIRMKCKQR